VTENELQAAESYVGGLRGKQTTAPNAHSALGERISELAHKVERAEELKKDLENQRSEYSIYRLALDLHSNRFQAYLLRETLRIWRPAHPRDCGA
jgi:hypothetical protein